MKIPILTIIYRILGLLAFVGAACVWVYAFSQSQFVAFGLVYGVGLIVAGLISLGIAEVVHLIAKIEFNTRESSHGYQMLKALQVIAKNTSKVHSAE